MSPKELIKMFDSVNISNIDSIEELKNAPMNIVICGTPYWDRLSCIIIEILFKRYQYNFKIHRFESVRDFYEVIVNLDYDEIDNIHAFISHNHSNSEKVLSILNKQKLESKKCICVSISSIRDDSRSFDFISSVKERLSESIDIFIDVFIGLKKNGYAIFIDALVEKWNYNIQCRNDNIKPEHITVDLHEKLKKN